VQRSVEDLAGRVAQGLVRRTRLADERLGRFSDRVASAMEQMLVRRRHAVERLAAQLDALSPLRVLERGFSMATDAEGRVLRRLADFPAGRAFWLRVSDGQVTARVEQETA
jgi:exodeoxyribonuclease VII large subunit